MGLLMEGLQKIDEQQAEAAGPASTDPEFDMDEEE
jgi:hypothetical protein